MTDFEPAASLAILMAVVANSVVAGFGNLRLLGLEPA